MKKTNILLIIFMIIGTSLLGLSATDSVSIVPNVGIGMYQLNVPFQMLEEAVGQPDEILKVQDDIALLIYNKDNIQVLLGLNKSEDEVLSQTLAIRTENPSHITSTGNLHVGDTVDTLIKVMGKPDKVINEQGLLQYVYSQRYVITIDHNKIGGIIVWYTKPTTSI